jgi:hypothetical protein
MKNINKNIKFITPIVFLLIFSLYLSFGLLFSGPSILSDEIGYLLNAAAISGDINDAASSWHFGYSFFISIAFLLTNNTEYIWYIVILLNSLIFLIGHIFLYKLIKLLYPEMSQIKKLAILVIASITPGMIVINSYVFSTPLFYLVLMITLYVIAIYNYKSVNYSILLGILMGLLYWIHPVGIAVVIGVLASLSFEVIKRRDRKSYISFTFIILGAIGTILTYMFLVSPYYINLMTPDGYEPISSHYDKLSNNISRLFEYEKIINILIMSAGALAYLLIASYATFTNILMKSIEGLRIRINNVDAHRTIILALSLSAILIILIGSVNFVLYIDDNYRIDHWFYGRYIEMILVPIIAIGLTMKINKRLTYFSIIYIVLIGTLLTFYVGKNNTIDFVNAVNLASIWAVGLINNTNILLWFAISVIPIFIYLFYGLRALLPTVLLVLSSILLWQYNFHISLQGYEVNRKPDYVNNLRADMNINCIGFSDDVLNDVDSKNRIRALTFYLHDYELHRSTFERWIESSCGVYITDCNHDLTSISNIKLIVNDSFAKLCIIKKS